MKRRRDAAALRARTQAPAHYPRSPTRANTAPCGSWACTIQLQFNTQNGAYAYDAGLEIHAGYVQAEAEVSDGLRAVAGVRYETAREEVTPIGNPSTSMLSGVR